jgi:hypothetical protein
MSIKSKLFAAAATLTLVGGVGAAGALTAGTATAATPSCGAICIDIFSHNYGTHVKPSFVFDVLRQGDKVGQPVILFRTSNSDPAEDFTVSNQGLVSDFYTAGLVTSSLALHYGGLGCEHYNGTICTRNFPDDYAFEFQYSPDGVDSGLCVGTPTTAGNDTFVSLQPCGVSAKTVWILDVADRTGRSFFDSYAPLINGSETNFSNPYVLSYPQNSYPTDWPRPVLATETLQTTSHHTVNNNQQWGADFGILP